MLQDECPRADVAVQTAAAHAIPMAVRSDTMCPRHSEEKDILNDAILGKTLAEVNEPLYRETVRELRRGVRRSGTPVGEAEAEQIARRLASAVIRERCGCRQDDCATYTFTVPNKPPDSVEHYVVELDSRGIHLVHIDSDGDIFTVERLYDLSDGPLTKYARRLDGKWEMIRHYRGQE